MNLFRIRSRLAIILVTVMVGVSAVLGALPRPIGFAFAKGVKFTVAGYSGSTPLTGFPVLVRLAANSPAGFSYADLSSATGADLCFIDMDGNGLPFEIETWNASGESLIWVRLPSMTNGTEFVMCWGGETSGKAVCNENPFSGYVGVWHMSEASGTVADSSGHGLTATPTGTNAENLSIAGAGPVGNGRQCADKTYLSVVNTVTLDVGDTFAVSGWFNVASTLNGDARFFSRKIRNQSTNDGWEVIKKGSAIAVRGATGDNIAAHTPSPALTQAGWKHVFVVYNGNSATIYEDGVEKKTASGGAAPIDNDNSFSIGSYSGGASSYFVGSVDECRLLDAVPTADWAKAEYDSMNNAAFLTSDEAETYGALVDLSAGISVSNFAFTNAAIGVSVGALGSGASSASVLVQLAATADFTSPVWSTTYSVTAPGLRTIPVAGLATNATYFAQALVTNSLGTSTVAGPVSFTTLAPGAPEGTVAFLGRTTTTLSATASLASFGAGSSSATVRLEASEDAEFETITAVSAEAYAVAGQSTELIVSGLSSGSVYQLRVRFVNEWGLEKIVSLGAAFTRGGSGVDGLYVDSLGTGNGTSPDNALPTIHQALALAGSGDTIWVRGGGSRLYRIAAEAGTLFISGEKEGLSIRAYGETPGDDGRATVEVSDSYIADGGRTAIVANLAERVTLQGLRFNWTTESLGKNNVANCPLIANSAPFLTVEDCEFVFSGTLPGYGQSGLHQPIIGCLTVPATNLVVAGCSFFNCRPNDDDLGRGYKLLQVRDNAHIERCVFSNCTDIVRGIQLKAGGDICTGFVSFSSNVVFQLPPGSNRPVFIAGYDGPRNISVSYNRFVNDPSEPSARIFHKGREGFQNGPEFHHNTVVGFREFIYAENLAYNASTLKASIFDNIFILAADMTNIVENSGNKINPPSCPPTMFKSGSFYRNNALLTGAFNGGTAAALQYDDWTYDITAGLVIDNTFVLGSTTVPAGTVSQISMPEFVQTNNIFHEDFYRYKSVHGEGDFGRLGWAGENNEYPTYIGALPPLYPDETLIIVR